MGTKEFCIKFFVHYIILAFVNGMEWDYSQGETGPANWSAAYSNCSGSKQSPINLAFGNFVIDNTLSPINFNSYEKPLYGAVLRNNGKTVNVVVPENETYTLSPHLINNFDSTVFKLMAFHFHWSQNDSVGSEHSIDGVNFPLELHLVHRYVGNDSIPYIFNDLVVAAVFFTVTDHENTNGTVLQLITDHMKFIRKKDSNVTLQAPLNLHNLLPSHKELYLRYSGSLTTPPCSENVEWLILMEPQHMSKSQMQEFRSLTVNGRDILGKNVRSRQSLNGRKIFLRSDAVEMFMSVSQKPAGAKESIPVVSDNGTNKLSQDFRIEVLLVVLFFMYNVLKF